MLSASQGEPEYLNNVYSLRMYGTIYRLQCVFRMQAANQSMVVLVLMWSDM